MEIRCEMCGRVHIENIEVEGRIKGKFECVCGHENIFEIKEEKTSII